MAAGCRVRMLLDWYRRKQLRTTIAEFAHSAVTPPAAGPESEAQRHERLFGWREYVEVERTYWDYVPVEGDEVPSWGGGA